MLASPNVRWLTFASGLICASGWAATAFMFGATHGTGALILSSMVSGGMISAMFHYFLPKKRTTVKIERDPRVDEIIRLWRELQAQICRYIQLMELYLRKVQEERLKDKQLIRKLTYVWSAATYVMKDVDFSVKQDLRMNTRKVGKAAVDNLRDCLGVITVEETWVLCK
jgi:hypothetical protein